MLKGTRGSPKAPTRMAVRRDRNFVGEIAVGSPVKWGEIDGSARGLDGVYGLGDDFFPDAVAWNHGNMHFSAHAGNVSTAVKR